MKCIFSLTYDLCIQIVLMSLRINKVSVSLNSGDIYDGISLTAADF